MKKRNYNMLTITVYSTKNLDIPALFLHAKNVYREGERDKAYAIIEQLMNRQLTADAIWLLVKGQLPVIVKADCITFDMHKDGYLGK